MDNPEICEVCREPFRFGGWCISHGQGTCAHCGAVYMLRGESAPECLLDEEGREIARGYYEETGEPAVFAQNDGVTKEQAEKFEDWCQQLQEDQ